MNKIFFIFILAICFLTSSSQNNPLKYGGEFTTAAYPDEEIIINSDSAGFYLLNNSEDFKSSGSFLFKFDAVSGQKIYEKELKYNYTGTLSLVAAKNIEGKINLFLSVSSGDLKVKLFRHQYKAESGEENGEAVLIDEFEPGFETGVIRNFEAIYSPDNSKIVILKQELTDSRDQIISAKVYETNSNKKIWEQRLNSDSENQIPSGHDFLLTNDGRFCFVYETADNGSGVKILYGDYIQNKTVMLPAANTILNPKIEIVNNSLICSAEILEGKGKAKYLNESLNMGFLLMEIDPATAEIKSENHDFLTDELKAKLNYKDKDPYYFHEGIKSFQYSQKSYKHFRAFFLNGCYYAVNYHGYDWSNQNSFGSVNNYTNAKEIIIIKYKNFKVEWMRIIPRNNKVESKMGMNFILSKKLHLFYFDNPENLVKFPDLKSYDPKKYKTVKASTAALVNLTIDENGEIKRELIPSDKDWYLPHNSITSFLPYSKSTIVTTSNKKKRRFDLISVKD